MKRNILKIGVLSLALFTLTDCARTVTRIDADKQVDLSGRWNDTDSKLVAQEMIKDVLARQWRENFFNKTNKKPTVIIGIISNKSSEFIEAETFVKDIEKEFINSGMVRVVQSSTFREKLRRPCGRLERLGE